MTEVEFSRDFLDSLGILDWGYTEESNPQSFKHYDEWVNKNHHGDLKYLSDHRKNLRSDLKLVYPQFQSALVFLFSYHPTKKWMLENNHHEVAAYSLGFEGEDYHYNLKRKLQLIADNLNVPLNFSLDTQPVLERDLAYRAGLGWFGKNSMLIHRTHGSYFIIGTLILDKKLNLKSKILETDHCGHCTKCADECPTHAIDLESRTLIANKCISTFTIEMMKEVSPPEGIENSRGEIFGCDICQDVCPWNKKSLLKVTSRLYLRKEFEFLKSLFFEMTKNEILKKMMEFSNKKFKSFFYGTSFDRPGKKGWIKNFITNQNDS